VTPPHPKCGGVFYEAWLGRQRFFSKIGTMSAGNWAAGWLPGLRVGALCLDNK
jgi:hypothetical protein